MPNVNASFQGQTLILPGAYYADNVQAVTPDTPPTTPPLIFIGYGYGGKPLTPLPFTNAQDLLNTIRGGPCSGYVQFLTNPSPQVLGAQLITYINPGENTQSTLALSAGTTGIITLTSTNYGLPSNLLQAQVVAGSLQGKKLTLYDGFLGTTLVQDNLGVPFQLAYTGAATGVTWSVQTSGQVATGLTLSSPTSGQSSTISFAGNNFPTVAQVVNFINGTGFYSAIPIGDGTMPSSLIDSASGTLAPPVSGVNQYNNITAAVGSVFYAVNQYGGNFATAVIATGLASLLPTLAPNNIPFTSFSGATSVPPTNTDYANALNAALAIPGWAVFIDSNSPAVQALGTQHCLTASTPAVGKWRRFFTGSSLGDSVNTTISNSQALNAICASYAYPGIFRVNTITGQNQLWSGLFAAAAAAGMATGNQVAMPLTNKTLIGTGVEVALTLSQINQLQQAGVMCIIVPQNTGVPTIVSDLTTWQVDNNPENVFNQQVACRYYLAYSLVNAAQPYVGTIASNVTESQILNAIKACLNALIYTPGSGGVLNSWDPASLILKYNGATQTAAVTVNVVLVGQNRFITIYVPIQPLNLTLTTQSLSLAAAV